MLTFVGHRDPYLNWSFKGDFPPSSVKADQDCPRAAAEYFRLLKSRFPAISSEKILLMIKLRCLVPVFKERLCSCLNNNKWTATESTSEPRMHCSTCKKQMSILDLSVFIGLITKDVAIDLCE